MANCECHNQRVSKKPRVHLWHPRRSWRRRVGAPGAPGIRMECRHNWLVVTGTWLDYDFPSYIGNKIIIPTVTNTPSFFRGVGQSPASIYIYIYHFHQHNYGKSPYFSWGNHHFSYGKSPLLRFPLGSSVGKTSVGPSLWPKIIIGWHNFTRSFPQTCFLKAENHGISVRSCGSSN